MFSGSCILLWFDSEAKRGAAIIFFMIILLFDKEQKNDGLEEEVLVEQEVQLHSFKLIVAVGLLCERKWKERMSMNFQIMIFMVFAL